MSTYCRARQAVLVFPMIKRERENREYTEARITLVRAVDEERASEGASLETTTNGCNAIRVAIKVRLRARAVTLRGARGLRVFKFYLDAISKGRHFFSFTLSR